MNDRLHRDEDQTAQPSPSHLPTQANSGASRREALIKMGKFAAYTAPVMTILLTADNSSAAKQNCKCVGGRCTAAGGSTCATGISGKACLTDADC